MGMAVGSERGGDGVTDERDRQRLLAGEDPVDQAVFQGLPRREIGHAVGILRELLHAAAGVVGEHLQHHALVVQHFLGADLDVAGLAAGTGAGLVQHDRGVGQGGPVALGARREDHRGGAHGLADADGVHRRLHVADGVADGEGLGFEADGIAGIPAGAGGVDVEEDRLLGIVELEIEKLGNDQLGHIDPHLTLGVVV
jgi:hypothetical protein